MIAALAPILSALLFVLAPQEGAAAASANDPRAEKALESLTGLRDVSLRGEVRAFWRTQHDATPLAKGTFSIETHGSDGGRLRMEIPALGAGMEGSIYETGFGGGGAWDFLVSSGKVLGDERGIARLHCALTGGSAWRDFWKEASLDPGPPSAPAGSIAVRLRPSGAPEGDLFVIDAAAARLVEARIHIEMARGDILVVSVRHGGSPGPGKGSTVTIDREHYRFVLTIETMNAGPGVEAFRLPRFLQDKKETSLPTTEILTLNEVHTAHIRKRVRMADLSKEFATLLPAVMSHLRAQGVNPVGAPYARYWSMPAEEIDIEVGFPVPRPLPATDTIQAGKLPGGRVVSTWHVGPYHELGRTWQEAMAWMTKNGLQSRAAPWEVYWTDPGLEPDSSKWRTQILLPVQ